MEADAAIFQKIVFKAFDIRALFDIWILIFDIGNNFLLKVIKSGVFS